MQWIACSAGRGPKVLLAACKPASGAEFRLWVDQHMNEKWTASSRHRCRRAAGGQASIWQLVLAALLCHGVAVACCQDTQLLHSHNLVHRDLRWANVFNLANPNTWSLTSRVQQRPCLGCDFLEVSQESCALAPSMGSMKAATRLGPICTRLGSFSLDKDPNRGCMASPITSWRCFHQPPEAQGPVCH